ncbi:transglutaminaseTgpA domain-containing protein [Nocardioides gansuensis]|nr:DUF3488 and transglutaminase-like domain-containing protein [Nocardioides gansuensis]
MSRVRPPLPRALLHAVVTALTGWATLLSWRVLTSDSSEVMMPLLFAALLLCAGGAALRWLRVPTVAVIALQVLVAGGLLLANVAGNPFPTDTTLASFGAHWQAALESSRLYAAPVPPHAPPVHPILLVGGLLVVLALDVVAGSLDRVTASGLVLLAAYSMPATLTGDSVSWWVFLAAAAGYLAMVFLQHDDHIDRWGRTLGGIDGDLTAFGVRTGAVRHTAFSLGAVATASALLLPMAVPTLELTLLPGTGPGTREIEVEDPLLDMRRDLQRGEDVPLVYVETRGARPSYLRLSVLTHFADNTWSPGDREIPEEQTAGSELPGLQGVDRALRRTEQQHHVDVSEDFRSTWLPTSEHVTEVQAPPLWRYDISTMDFISSEEDQTTAGLSYDFTAVALDYEQQRLDASMPGTALVRPIFSDVPADLSPQVRELASEVTAQAPTRFQKAVALQQWFREEGGFVYDASAVEEAGDGDDMSAFLEERSGYCEQFAATMAIMARTLGIPARVSVGFLIPRSVGDDRWEFSAWDLHAWPELYFPGSGWMRFEPTPGSRAPQVPSYTQGQLSGPLPSVSPGASGAGQERPTRPTEPPAAPDTGSGTGSSDDSVLPRGMVLGVAAGLLVLLALVLLPRFLRQARRRRRLAGGIEELWLELRSVATDLGHAWPAGRSPRAQGAWLGRVFGRPGEDADRVERPVRGREQAPEAADALDRLVGALERSRYAREPGESDLAALRADVTAVEAALTAGVSRRTLRRATWWPRSLRLDPRGRTVSTAPSRGEAPVQVATAGGVVDRVE